MSATLYFPCHYMKEVFLSHLCQFANNCYYLNLSAKFFETLLLSTFTLYTSRFLYDRCHLALPIKIILFSNKSATLLINFCYSLLYYFTNNSYYLSSLLLSFELCYSLLFTIPIFHSLSNANGSD